jgi:SNF2 family DNA or RNA helicase
MPLTVHAAWIRADALSAGSQLCLWAEDPDAVGRPNPVAPAPPAGTARPGNGRQRLPKVPSHPGQVPIGQLRNLLSHELAALPGPFHPANLVVWLPSQGSLPLARRGVFQTNGAAGRSTPVGEAPLLAAWQVTGLALDPLSALLFLSHLSNTGRQSGDSALPRLRLANDLLFWSNAAKFALEILVGQHYLPSLRGDQAGRLAAVWQPILLDPRVEQRREQLVRTMPPICRAYNLDSPADAPAPAALTEHFVATLVDAAVRAWGNAEAPAAAATPALHWLQRLLTPQPQLGLPPQPAHELYQEWHQWTEQLFVVRDANFRICFLLEEPELAPAANGEELSLQHVSWKLHYYLQARDNPNLMVSAREIWQAPNNAVRVGSRHVDQPQERLLAGLGVASRLFAPIERSLRNPRPELSLLSTEEAYRFLREIGPLLESSGFGLVVPDWWNASRRMRLGLRLRLTSDAGLGAADLPDSGQPRRRETRPGGLSLNSLIAYSWELVLGGESLSEAAFEQLTAMRTPLLRLGERWVELEPHQVEAAKRFLAEQQPGGVMSLLQAIRVVQEHADAQPAGQTPGRLPPGEEAYLPMEIAPPGDAGEILPLDTVVVNGWLETTLERLRSQQPWGALAEPSGFVGELRAYQRRGVGWLAHLRYLGLGACLADDMGLGKTVQAIALLLHVRHQAEQANGSTSNGHDAGNSSAADHSRLPPTLLICPTSVVANWRREVERFAPGLCALVHHGNTRLSGEAFAAAVATHDLIITSFGTARRDVELLKEFEWSNLILDEAQNIKTPGAKQTQAVRRLRARNRIALTGTPVENRLSELWSIMEFLNPGYLGRHEHFRQRYIVPIERYNDATRTDELRRLVQPFLLRRLKSDPSIISDLPEKNEMVVYCSLTREQAALYETVVQESLAELNRSDGIQRRGLVLALLTKLKQITNHPAHFLKQTGPLAGRSGKLNRLGEMLEEALSVGDRALIFTQFVEMGHLLQRHLRDTLGVETLFLHGSTPAAQRDKMVQAFQSEDGPAVFVLSLRAGGAGLNLTRANHVFHYDRWWNPAVENQATDRAFRIGQQRNVQVHKYVVAGTLEERIHDLIESKQALAQSIVGSGEDWLTELDTDQLRDLLMLRYDAIEDE